MHRIEIQKELLADPGTETVEVWGEIEVDPVDLIRSRDLRLKSIQNIQFTADVDAMVAMKQVFNKGRKMNYASVYVWNLRPGTVVRATGSIWLNFHALGE